MPPFSGDALLAMIAREHPEVRRILLSRTPAVAPLTDDAAHAIVKRPLDPARLFAAIADD
jgi:hypothetical protein